MSRDPYPHHEPLAFAEIDTEVPSGQALARGLAVLGVILLLTACLWI